MVFRLDGLSGKWVTRARFPWTVLVLDGRREKNRGIRGRGIGIGLGSGRGVTLSLTLYLTLSLPLIPSLLNNDNTMRTLSQVSSSSKVFGQSSRSSFESARSARS